LFLSAKGVIWETDVNPDLLRPNEKSFLITKADDGMVVAIIDLRERVVLEATLSIF
jgi:hypothetical protein